MEKGQISIDFMLAIIIALIFVGGFQVVTASFEASQKTTVIRNQEVAIGNSLAEIIETSAALNESDPNASFEVKYTIPYIYEPGNDVPQACDIQIKFNKNSPTDPAQNYINVTWGQGPSSITMQIPAANTLKDNINKNKKCGETVTIKPAAGGKIDIT